MVERNASTKYIYYKIRPAKLTAAFAKNEYAKLLKRLPEAEEAADASAWIQLFRDWNALQAYISGEAARNYFYYSQNHKDKSLAAIDKYFREKIVPVITEPEHKLVLSFLASQHRPALLDTFGLQLARLFESQVKPLDPINTDLGIKAGQLTDKYNKLIAGADIKLNGKIITMSQAEALYVSDDRKVRQQAYEAVSGWFLKHHEELALLFDELVKLRHQMGLNLGFDSYLPLAYLNRGRFDYSRKMVERFRASVLKHLTPLYVQMVENQAKELKIDKLRTWDLPYNPSLTLPPGIAPVKTQLQKSQEVFDKLSPQLGRHFARMRRQKLIDLEDRPNKRAGAYCIDFSDTNQVAILLNSIGNAEDIRTLMHEMGHAFQGWESTYIEAIELQSGMADLAEVYSLSMEFLSLPYMNIFFSEENAAKYSKNLWLKTLQLLCYCCIVDEFQHFIYDNPKISVKARDKKWVEIAEKYQPGVDWTGFEKYKALRWYKQQHIFNSPFYYIDYALATTAALQIAILADKNHKKGLDIYLEMCKFGGTRSFLGALAETGLKSPFDDALIPALAKRLAKALD